MNTQNILNFYGRKLDLKLDSSEFYDYEIDPINDDYNREVLDLTRTIDYDSQILSSICITGTTINIIKPWVITVGTGYSEYNCDFTVRRRTERGWTLNFVFNRESLPWISGSTFYFLGLSGATTEREYGDNNFGLSFTDDGRVKWDAFRYSGYCQTDSGYTETYYSSSGQTPILCTDGVSNDFNLTITFKRGRNLENCDIPNVGGWNDLITGRTEDFTVYEWLTGATETYQDFEVLNEKWNRERDERKGILKFYLNGNPIYKQENWEEIIPSLRLSGDTMVQMWGGGTTGYTDTTGYTTNNVGYENPLSGTTNFNLKYVSYLEEPLNAIQVKHYYLTSIKPQYNIVECQEECIADVVEYITDGLITESEDPLLTEEGFLLSF